MPLLQISTTPTRWNLQVSHAHLEYSIDKGSVDPNTKTGYFTIENEPTQIRIDSTDFRESLGLSSAFSSAREAAELGKQAAQEAIARYAEIGNQLKKIYRGVSVADAFYGEMSFHKQYSIAVAKPAPVEISWTEPHFEMQYTPAEVTFDVRNAKVGFEFVPGKLAFNITQYPKVEIEVK